MRGGGGEVGVATRWKVRPSLWLAGLDVLQWLVGVARGRGLVEIDIALTGDLVGELGVGRICLHSIPCTGLRLGRVVHWLLWIQLGESLQIVCKIAMSSLPVNFLSSPHLSLSPWL